MTTLKLLLLLLFVSFDTFGQVKMDHTVKARYISVFNKMELQYQQNSTQFEKENPYLGSSIFTVYQLDTLNKEDMLYSGGDVTVEDINPSPNKQPKKDINENIYIPAFTTATLVNDSLELVVGGPFPPIIYHRVYQQNATSYYEENYKYDSVLQLELKDPKVSKLLIPIKTKIFLISSSSFKEGQVIYGQVEFETVPYYYETSEFKNNYIKKRLRCVYFFKVRVKEENP